MPKSLDHYLGAFRSLNVNRAGGQASPHKPCMLLAVLGLAEAGDLRQNEIRYEPALLERYLKFFQVVRRDSDHANPYFPFFHLKSDGFWHLHPLEGRAEPVRYMDTARSSGAITSNIEFVSLDPELHELALTDETRSALRDELVFTWFGKHAVRLNAVLQEEKGSDRYERLLRDPAGPNVSVASERPPEPIRSAAFRRLVNENYDYRCAASGWRIILPDSRVMVEAAHLVPFADSYDDDPCNGVALVPSFHWALDANIIAPGPDFKWHVSDALDERIADNKPLVELQGRQLILPKKKANWPKKEALQWRLDRLLSSKEIS